MPKFDANEMLNGLFAQSFPQTPSGGAPQASPEMNPLPTSMATVEDAQVPAAAPQAATVAPVDQQVAPETAPKTPTQPMQPAVAPIAEPNAADQWEQEWKDQYNVSAKDLVGEDTYNKLRMLADEKLSHAQILGLMAVVATNPQAGWQMIEAKENRKQRAIEILADLGKHSMTLQKGGLAQIAQTKREEAKSQAAQDKEDAKIKSAEYKQRVAASTDVLNDVTSKGLPEGTVVPPTQEELDDPEKFWKQWMPSATGGVAKFVGKQEILKQLTTRQASPWLNSLAVMDPKHGVENYLRGTKHFSEEEIAQLQASVIPGFTQAAAQVQQKSQAEIGLTNAKAAQANASVAKYGAQANMLREKLKTIGQMTPQQQAQLKLQAEKIKADIRAKQVLWMEFSDRYANVGAKTGDQNWSSTVTGYINGASELQTQFDAIDEISQQVDAQAANRSMTVAEALPVSAEESVQDTMRRYQGTFSTPEELQAVVYSDMEPDTPEKREARNFFFMRLIVGIQSRAGGHPSDIYNQLDTASNSLIDAYAKHNVSVPPMAGQMAAGTMQQQPQQQPAQ